MRQVEGTTGPALPLTRWAGLAGRPGVHAALISALLCLANVGKPLTADDPAYVAFARHIAASPQDPYGFTIHWYEEPQPANEVLAPPVFLYWLAAGISVVGEDPRALKIWVWPWCFLFASAVVALCRRFATPIALPLSWLIAGSPTILPGINLMLDVPALALSLWAIVLFQRLGPASGWLKVASVGVVTGVAIQTKYTALTTPVAIGLAAWCFSANSRDVCRRQTVSALVIALATCLSWELWIASKYGSSHFVFHALRQGEPLSRKLRLVGPLVGILGGVGAPLVVLGLAVRGVSRWIMIAILVLVALSWIALIVAPPEARVRLPGIENAGYSANNLAVGWIGVTVLGLMVTSMNWERSGDRFLTGWWLLEFGAYFALSPWGAVRRVIGLVLVGLLLIGSRVRDSADRTLRRRTVVAAILSVGLGLVFQAIDSADARAVELAVAEATRIIRSEGVSGTVWYRGFWGVRYYGERAGWVPQSANDDRIGRRDCLVIAVGDRTTTALPSEGLRRITTVEAATGWPLRTFPTYYGKNKAIEQAVGPAIVLEIYRLVGES